MVTSPYLLCVRDAGGYAPAYFLQCPLMDVFAINKNNASLNLQIASKSLTSGGNMFWKVTTCFTEKHFPLRVSKMIFHCFLEVPPHPHTVGLG